MGVILYIHGFNSGPGEKSKILEKEFPNMCVITPQLQNKPLEDLKTLQSILDGNGEVHVVATSLGGFYGLCLAFTNNKRDDLSFYLINPSLIPYDSFRQKLGYGYINYKNGEQFIITKNFLDELKDLQKIVNTKFRPHSNIYFFLGTGDKVLDHSILKDTLSYSQLSYNLFESPQDHRHEDISGIVSQIKQNSVL